MGRLKDGETVTDVAAGGKAQPADQLRGQVGDDVSKHVAGYQDPIILRVLYQPHRHCVHVGLPQLDAGKLSRNKAGLAHHKP